MPRRAQGVDGLATRRVKQQSSGSVNSHRRVFLADFDSVSNGVLSRCLSIEFGGAQMPAGAVENVVIASKW
jgi:hypothetical protein